MLFVMEFATLGDLEQIVVDEKVELKGSDSTQYQVSASYQEQNPKVYYESMSSAEADDSSASYDVQSAEHETIAYAQDIASDAQDDRLARRATYLIDGHAKACRDTMKDVDPVSWYLMNEPTITFNFY